MKYVISDNSVVCVCVCVCVCERERVRERDIKDASLQHWEPRSDAASHLQRVESCSQQQCILL